MLARMMHAARPPGNHGEGLTQAASDALQDPGSDPADAAGAAADSRAAQDGHDGFLHRTESLLADPAWTDPPAVIVAAASPPPRSALHAGGLAAAVGGLVSLVIGVALGTLVDIVWPAGERRPSFYDNPYWPQSGDEPGTQLIATKGSTNPLTSSSAEGRWTRTRRQPALRLG